MKGHPLAFELHLETETVGHMNLPKPLCVEPSVSVREVLNELKARQSGSVSVCQDGKLVGMFTERDALRLLASGGGLDQPIEAVMTRNPAVVLASETVTSAIAKMSEGGYRRLPVVDGAGRPVGLLKVSTILHYLVQHFPKFVYNLPPCPNQRPQEREGA
ncbi:MAG: CBS domain-containing protein [Planctomycetales bacterium]|nr:CBS domain-containing protein [Planctomycetales bacterium]MCA9168619.1 CBS domain-containing protein [Planctomycetales bacterium]